MKAKAAFKQIRISPELFDEIKAVRRLSHPHLTLYAFYCQLVKKGRDEMRKSNTK